MTMMKKKIDVITSHEIGWWQTRIEVSLESFSFLLFLVVKDNFYIVCNWKNRYSRGKKIKVDRERGSFVCCSKIENGKTWLGNIIFSSCKNKLTRMLTFFLSFFILYCFSSIFSIRRQSTMKATVRCQSFKCHFNSLLKQNVCRIDTETTNE